MPIDSRIANDAVARDFDGEEFRGFVARALEQLSNRGVQIGEDLISRLESWLDAPLAAEDEEVENPDSEEELNAPPEAPSAGRDASSTASEEACVERSLVWGHGSFGSYPGRDLPIVEALINIRLVRGERDLAVATMSRFLQQEKGIRQWDVLSEHFRRLGGTQLSASGDLIEKVLTTVPGVVGSEAFAQFLCAAQAEDYELVERNLDAWKNGGAAAVQAYGEIVGLGALLHPQREKTSRRLDEIIGDSEMSAAQVGAALSAAHVLAQEPGRRVQAARTLESLLALSNPAVWPAAFEFFRLAEELVPDEGTVKFLRAVAVGISRSETIVSTFVVDKLATMLPHEAGLVGEIALALAAKWKTELADIRTSTAGATSPLVDLAVTLHRLGPETRDVGLQIFEQLIDIDAYEARQTLDEIDGRFRESSQRMRRPRLRRRSQVLPRSRRWARSEPDLSAT